MRLQLVLLVCLCLASLSLAKKGKKGAKIGDLKPKGRRCEREFELCKMMGGKDRSLTCHTAFIACKASKKRKGKKHGGSSMKRFGPKHHFCHCFKKLYGYIRKHHSKTNSDGQRLTVHERIFEIIKNATEGPKRDLPLINGRPNKIAGLKDCLRNFYCHHGKQCGPKRRGKRHGKKSKRKNKGAGFMSGKSRKGKKMGKRPWEKRSPLYKCFDSAKRCKVRARSRKKQLKVCAKAVFKCVQDECNKA